MEIVRFLNRPITASRRMAAPAVTLACLTGFLVLSAVSPCMHAAIPVNSHGHTAICKWVKDAQLCNHRSAPAMAASLPASFSSVPAFWFFMGMVAVLNLPRILQACQFWSRRRAPPRWVVLPSS